MNFNNHQLNPMQLPSISNLDFNRIEKKYLYVLLIAILILALVLTAALILVYSKMGDRSPVWLFPTLVIAASLIVGLGLISSIMSFKRMAYAIRERDIIFKKGWLWQSTAMIPFNRVQHCEVNQNPIERIFGLARIKIFTAGGASSDLTIPGLFPDTANQIKSYIVNKTSMDEEE